MNGHSSDVKSPSTATTREPRGSEAATSPTLWDTCAPAVTQRSSAPVSRANAARARGANESQCGKSTRPCIQLSSSRWISAWACSGDSPYVAVLSHTPSGLK